MKRKKILNLMGIVMTAAFLAVGCGSKTVPSVDESAKEENVKDAKGTSETEEPKTENSEIEGGTDKNQEEKNEQKSDTTEDTKDDSEEKQQVRTVKIYYINDETGQLESEETEVKDEQEIWTCLQNTGIITEECELLGITVDEESNRMELDFNSATGDRIRSMGTTGTEEILACIVDTYLDAYSCEKIKLTEEGNVPDTGDGANLDGYVGRIEL